MNKFGIIMCLGIFLAGAAAGYSAGFYNEHNVLVQSLAMITPLREHDPRYKFIDPLLAYVIPSVEEQGLASLKGDISDIITAAKNKGQVADASVFLSDLNRGRWIGVNENKKYNPASILKVVIMVTYFKEQETQSAILEKELVYIADLDALLKQNPYNTGTLLEIGKKYQVQYLIDTMITASDNGAEFLLLANINQTILADLYAVLGIENPDHVPGNFTISPRSYSLFFRILYSATYLRKSLSEQALQILSQATYRDAMVAGVPENITVAHKFGQYVTADSSGVQAVELHDCGIVYYPPNPYFLCVMTKGTDERALQAMIKNISEAVYKGYISYK